MHATKHALERLRERYGPNFNYSDLANLARTCRRTRQYRISRRHDGSRVMEVNYKNVNIVVVYNHIAKRIVTVLPENINV